MTPDDATPRAMTAEERVRKATINDVDASPFDEVVRATDAERIAEEHAAAATAELRAERDSWHAAYDEQVLRANDVIEAHGAACAERDKLRAKADALELRLITAKAGLKISHEEEALRDKEIDELRALLEQCDGALGDIADGEWDEDEDETDAHWRAWCEKRAADVWRKVQQYRAKALGRDAT